MQLYIMTSGRGERQVTYASLPPTLQKNVIFVLQAKEPAPSCAEKILRLPAHIKTLSPTKHWLAHTGHDRKKFGHKLVMLDDDLHFAVRRKDDPSKFRSCEPKDVIAMFKLLESKLDKYAHAGIMTREGGNRITNGKDLTATRMVRVAAYDVDVLRKHKIDFERMYIRQDMDATLQLLRLGYANCVISSYVQNQSGSGAEGGCARYRTLAVMEEWAVKLAQVHHPYVRVVQKTTASSWGGATRTDVVVAWKQAYQEGLRKRKGK